LLQDCLKSRRNRPLLARYSQAFTAGTSLSVSFNNMRQSSTQQFLRYNPYFVSQLSISFTQQLLNGFGYDVGRRFLEVAKNESKIMWEIVRLQVNTTMAQAQNTYWDLVAARKTSVSRNNPWLLLALLEDNRIGSRRFRRS
jgi:hypothetical protein